MLPSFSWFDQSFDLLIIDVLYICLIARKHTALIPIILIGAIMDSSSSVPFFFYIFSYVWVYVIVQLANQLLFQHSTVFVVVMALIAVLIQQGLILLLMFIEQGGQGIPAADFSILIRQLFWGVLIIPAGIWLANNLRLICLRMVGNVKRQMAHKYKGEL